LPAGPPKKLLSALLLLCVTAVWGATFPVVKDAVTSYGVIAFLAIRFAVASVVLVPLGARKSTRESWKVGGAIGLVLAGSYVLQTYGVRYTTATNSGIITGLFVVTAVIWNRALFGVRTPRVLWLATLGSVAGLALLTGGGTSAPGLGDLLTVGCAIGFGLHIALLDRYAKEHSAFALALAQLSCSTVVFALAWPFADPLTLPPASVWPAIAFTGMVASALGFYAQTSAQRRLPAIQAGMILTMEPVFAAVFGYVLAGDRLSWTQMAGGVAMVAALVVATAFHQAVPPRCPVKQPGSSPGPVSPFRARRRA